MASDSGGLVKLEPCPFCGAVPIVTTGRARVYRWQHPAGACVLSNLRISTTGRDKWNALPRSTEGEGEVERRAALGMVHALELIQVDLEAGDMPAKTRVKLALSRVNAWLESARRAAHPASEE